MSASSLLYPSGQQDATAQNAVANNLTWNNVEQAWQDAGDPYSGQFFAPGLGEVHPTVQAGSSMPGGDSAKVNQGDILTSANENGYSGSVDLTGVSNMSNTQDFGGVTGGPIVEHATAGMSPNALGDLAMAVTLGAATAISGGAILGAEAAGGAGTGAAGLSSTDAAAIYGDAGYGGAVGTADPVGAIVSGGSAGVENAAGAGLTYDSSGLVVSNAEAAAMNASTLSGLDTSAVTTLPDV